MPTCPVFTGPVTYDDETTVQLLVNLHHNTTAPLCHLFGCAPCTSPVVIDDTITSLLNASILYSAAFGLFTATTVSMDDRMQSYDYSLLLILNPFATHSFVYYAASVDFVDNYLQNIHSNDDSVFRMTALASNTEVRINSYN